MRVGEVTSAFPEIFLVFVSLLDEFLAAGDESGGMYGVAEGTIRLLLAAVDHGPASGGGIERDR